MELHQSVINAALYKKVPSLCYNYKYLTNIIKNTNVRKIFYKFIQISYQLFIERFFIIDIHYKSHTAKHRLVELKFNIKWKQILNIIKYKSLKKKVFNYIK